MLATSRCSSIFIAEGSKKYLRVWDLEPSYSITKMSNGSEILFKSIYIGVKSPWDIKFSEV